MKGTGFSELYSAENREVEVVVFFSSHIPLKKNTFILKKNYYKLKWSKYVKENLLYYHGDFSSKNELYIKKRDLKKNINRFHQKTVEYKRHPLYSI